MPFHVELRQGMRRAWAFNLEEERMLRTVLEPWRRGRTIELGDREWVPRDSTLRILSGPPLRSTDLAMGRGWANAERSAEDVTVELLRRAAAQAATVAILAESAAAQGAAAELLQNLGVATSDWAAVRARVLASASVASAQTSLGVAAVLLVSEGPEPGTQWLFDAGLALGALGGRAIVVQLGEGGLPSQLSGSATIRVDAGQPASLEALAERLRQAGCPARVTV